MKLRRSNGFNPHDEVQTFLKQSSRCGDSCAGGDSCQERAASSGVAGVVPKHENGCPVDVNDGPLDLVDEKDKNSFYTVLAMAPSENPDWVRHKLEDALHTLSFLF